MQKTCIIHPVLPSSYAKEEGSLDFDYQLQEILNLAKAIDLDVVFWKSFNVSRISPKAFLGQGQRAIVQEALENAPVDVVVFNHALSPVQQRNLEKEWDVKVIDRTGLILEIFGARAQTKEGRLQVELAALEYQKSRLVRSWTHLERQRGGAGFMGGPGERQIELDRRMIAARISKIKKDLEKVRRTRALERVGRERIPLPVIALVGYTNAGKSTLFNTLTHENVFAEDLLFATLDPKMRRLDLPGGRSAVLSDTVGFISDLPTHLVAAFRATLEQIAHADVIVHVIDSSNDGCSAQKQDVINILKDLGIAYEEDKRIIEVFNKADLLSKDALEDIERYCNFALNAQSLSALSGQGIDAFLALCAKVIDRHAVRTEFFLPLEDGKALAWLYRHAEIINRTDSSDGVRVLVRTDQADLNKFGSLFGYKTPENVCEKDESVL